ncbi:GAF domain-containing protein [Geopsychrobacter electrodiphilus]|uniref:GAF domain-containing protein n=1 Tax=Geopsychrobacter electrodiphilus TaxID=225196 RepID=UPI00037D93D5|nr:GAF domain-containing protein [Geopsychrobacter electrodiphilus]
MEIKEFCRNLDRLLASRDLLGAGLALAVKAIGQGLNVSTGEIALLLADEKAEALHFLWPRGLQNSGTIPFSSKESLAARTYRELEPVMNNNFSVTRHTSIFEVFPLKEQYGQALPIQKILSVPIRNRERCLGVLQVCRKAASHAEAGPDFTREQLLGAGLIARTLMRHL